MFVKNIVKEFSSEFEHAQMQYNRINKIFKETGLLELFERSKGETLIILSLAAGMCVDLEFIKYYAKIYQFQFRYYYVDSDKKTVQLVNENYADEERAHFAWYDACDRECIATAHPDLQDQNADIVFLLNTVLTQDAYPFWKMYFDIIPRLAKSSGHIVTTFLYDHEKTAFLPVWRR